MASPETTRRAGDAALKRISAIRAVGGPGEVRAALGELDRARRRDGTGHVVRDIAMALPWTALLLVRLVRDRRVAWRHRVAIVAASGYLLTPFDPIPDFLPVIGAMDDALVVVIVLRWIVRSVEPALLDEHWPGEPEVLVSLRALAGAAES